ncbi:hypothetical protein B296_00027258 [Ensete ventricosum]|uniref:Uncharacterized protein n=1 Tax=Ensete ventricosum TaxID=4639 RepID=A0A426YGG8_ENSVE|nr:hypothetical protein B296_00027258 [Ensete ventricosum]
MVSSRFVHPSCIKIKPFFGSTPFTPSFPRETPPTDRNGAISATGDVVPAVGPKYGTASSSLVRRACYDMLPRGGLQNRIYNPLKVRTL